jgi:glycosyltransferase involved in cell wall biosynthesis
MTEDSDLLRERRVVVITSSLSRGYNELWDAVQPHVGEMTVVGARPPDAERENAPVARRVELRAVDLGRGLVWQHLIGLRRLLSDLRPDLVYVNRELWTVVAQEVVGVDTAVVVHGAENLWHHGGRAEQAIRDRLVTRALRHIRGYASWNHAGAKHVERLRVELGLPPFPTLVLPPVVSPATYHAVRWDPPDADTLEVLLVGRATAQKGFGDVIDAVAGIRGVRLTLCGEGDLLDDLVRRAREREVVLDAPGFINAEELARRMAAAHILVQPSVTTPDWAEQFGRAVAEGMAVGLPCLVSDSGELPHLVGHDPRAVFGEGDAADLREHLIPLLEHLRGSTCRVPSGRWPPAGAPTRPVPPYSISGVEFSSDGHSHAIVGTRPPVVYCDRRSSIGGGSQPRALDHHSPGRRARDAGPIRCRQHHHPAVHGSCPAARERPLARVPHRADRGWPGAAISDCPVSPGGGRDHRGRRTDRVRR